ncbi:MAG: sugar ABC transporter substrate-binding protein [Planctomycetes bacterium]|nr:sugar ABC transporter substrate-binding protein [Planctomycetota bacterium]
MNDSIKVPALIQPALLAAAAVLLFGGCRREEAQPQGAKKPRIALIMKSLANEFFLTMENGARAHHQAHPNRYDLIANGIKDELDVSKQIELVEQMAAQKVDAMVIAPADSKALVPPLKKVQEAGIVVINIDNQLDETVLAASQAKIPFVGPDNRKGAKAVGDHLARRLKAGDPVAIIEGAPNAYNAIQRRLGFEDAVKAAGLKIASSQSGYWETDKANQVAAAVITEHPGLKAMLCANDSMALGAVAALRAAGRLDQVLVAGYDNIAAVQQLMKEGKIAATADQHADKLAVFGIEYALDMLKTKSLPADRETPVDLITGAGARAPSSP